MPSQSESSGSDLLRTRGTLLFRLRDWKDGASWREFYDLYYGYVYRHARGSGLDHHEAEEVAQEVFQSIAQQIAKFEPQPRPGSFRRWLGNQARWRVIDKLRARQKSPSRAQWRQETDDRTSTIERVPDERNAADLRLELEWREQVYETALSRLARKVSPKHFQVFHLHHRDAWPLKRVAKELGITRASAYVINHRLKHLLRDEVRKLEAELE